HQLVYDHPTLRTNATYEVMLEPGYRDPAGNTYTLRHHWSFITEGPPGLSGSNPTNGEGGVDPSAYLSLDFSRVMEPSTLTSAVSRASCSMAARSTPSAGRREGIRS